MVEEAPKGASLNSGESKPSKSFWILIYIVVGLLFLLLDRLDLQPIINSLELTDVLALTLAHFSIVMSYLFYKSGADASSTFYDNTYHFTQHTSEILGRIEERFGEKLTNIDQGYASFRDRFEKLYGGKSHSSEREERARMS